MQTPPRAMEILGQAIELAPGERPGFLASACQGDEGLRAEVQSLLAAHERAGGFLAEPGLGPADETSAFAAAARDFLGPSGAGHDPAAMLGTTIGRYTLRQVIGEGGHGTVYMAEQTEPVRRRVALKLIKPGMDSQQVLARFDAERQALALMDHSGIATVLDGGTTEQGRPYFVMELVRGTPITEFCDASNLPPRERLILMIDVIGAVQHAHQKGVIHRDLKPANILVTLEGGRPVPKVIDFGIAKAIHGPLTERTLFTEFRQMVGTPQYMSPEQAEMSSIDVDTRTDVYALGVVLYELLVGSPPFSADELAEAGLAGMQRMLKDVEPPRPSVRLSTLGGAASTVAVARSIEPDGLRKLVRGELDWIVMTAMDKDRRRRYQAAAEMAADLRRYLEDEPVSAAPPSAAYRTLKFVRRHRTAVAAAAAVGLSLVIGATAATVFAVRARESASLAREASANARDAASEARLRAAENERLVYAVSLQAADAAIRNGDPDEARRRLSACAAPARGWAWAWINREATDPSVAIGEHAEPGIRDVAYSPDGRLLASVGTDRVVRIWDLAGGQPMHAMAGHADTVTGAAFSPDGRRLATCSADRTVRVWDVMRGSEIATLAGHTSWVSGVAWDPRGTWFASAGGDSNVLIWDAETLEVRARLGGYAHDVWGIDASPDGARLATSTGDGQLVVWDVASGERTLERTVSDFGIWSVEYSPDGERVVVAGFDNRATVRDAASGDLRLELGGSNLPVRAATFTTDGRFVIVAGFGALRTFDAASGEPVARSLSEQGDLHAVAMHPQGQSLATGGTTADVRRWGSEEIAGPIELVGHRDLVFEVVAAPGGAMLYTAGADGSVRAWDRRTGGLEWSRSIERGGAFSVDVTPDGSTVITTGGDGMIRSWDAADGSPRWTVPFGGRARNLSIAPDGRVFASGAAPGSGAVAAIRRVDTGEVVHELAGHRGALARMAFSRTGDVLATTSTDGTVIVWSVDDGTPMAKLDASEAASGAGSETGSAAGAGAVGTPNSVCFGPGEGQLLVGHTGGTLVTWEWRSERIVRQVAAHNATIGAVDLSADGRRILTAAWHNPELRIWDADTGERLLEIDTHITGLSDARFLPGAPAIAASGMQGRVRVWEIEPEPMSYAWRLEFQRRAEDFATRTMAAEDLERTIRAAGLLRVAENEPAAALDRVRRAESELVAAAGRAERELPAGHPLHGQLKRELEWTREIVAARTEPVEVAPGELSRYAGHFGPVRIRVEGGRLIAVHEQQPIDQPLLAMGQHTWQSERIGWARVRFEVDAEGAVPAIRVMYLGRPDEVFPRRADDRD
ncbi:MAG: WD40 repeat domain-containing serine/threonine protein kinase [Phycisphaerales bacterium]